MADSLNLKMFMLVIYYKLKVHACSLVPALVESLG